MISRYAIRHTPYSVRNSNTLMGPASRWAPKDWVYYWITSHACIQRISHSDSVQVGYWLLDTGDWYVRNGSQYKAEAKGMAVRQAEAGQEQGKAADGMACAAVCGGSKCPVSHRGCACALCGQGVDRSPQEAHRACWNQARTTDGCHETINRSLSDWWAFPLLCLSHSTLAVSHTINTISTINII